MCSTDYKTFQEIINSQCIIITARIVVEQLHLKHRKMHIILEIYVLQCPESDRISKVKTKLFPIIYQLIEISMQHLRVQGSFSN